MPPNDKCILDPERDCIGKAAAALLERRIDELEEGQRKESEFRELYYKERLERARRDADLDARMSGMDEKLDKLLAWQEGQQAKPGKRWDAIVDKAIWAVLAAVIAFVLARSGL